MFFFFCKIWFVFLPFSRYRCFTETLNNSLKRLSRKTAKNLFRLVYSNGFPVSKNKNKLSSTYMYLSTNCLCWDTTTTITLVNADVDFFFFKCLLLAFSLVVCGRDSNLGKKNKNKIFEYSFFRTESHSLLED